MPLETRLLDNSFACEVLGLRLWEPLDDRTIGELRDLWIDHPVLVFRRQALSEHELADFSALLGPLERIVRTDWASPVRPELASSQISRMDKVSRSVAWAMASSNGTPINPTC
jgi:alpha-ketoglutarate-dependent taurine dioxygenase